MTWGGRMPACHSIQQTLLGLVMFQAPIMPVTWGHYTTLGFSFLICKSGINPALLT